MYINKAIGVFTVKRLHYYNGEYYTYGGFGVSFDKMKGCFRRTILIAHVARRSPGSGFYKLNTENVEVIALPYVADELLKFILMPYYFLLVLPHVKKMDLIHARVPDYTGILGVLLAKLYGIPVFMQTVADWKIEALKMPFHKKYGLGLLMKIYYWFYDLIEQLVSINQLVFAQGESSFNKHIKLSKETHLVLSSAHQNADIIDKLPHIRPNTNALKLLTVGRLTGVKNQKLAISLIAALRRQNTDATLTIVGDGPLYEELKSFADSLGVLPHIHFAGMIGHGQHVWTYYDEADIFILTSKSEGTPKVLMEAMARGIPVIAPNIGGIPSIITHKSNGLLFKEGDLNDLLLQVSEVINNVDLLVNMQQNGIVFSKSHSVEGVIDFILTKVIEKWPHLVK